MRRKALFAFLAVFIVFDLLLIAYFYLFKSRWRLSQRELVAQQKQAEIEKVYQAMEKTRQARAEEPELFKQCTYLPYQDPFIGVFVKTPTDYVYAGYLVNLANEEIENCQFLKLDLTRKTDQGQKKFSLLLPAAMKGTWVEGEILPQDLTVLQGLRLHLTLKYEEPITSTKEYLHLLEWGVRRFFID